MFCVWTGFHLACEYGHYDTVKVFLKYSSDSIYSNKINLNAPDEFGYTGFHVACREGFPKIVELIMKSSEALKINLNAKSNSVGYTGKVIDTKYSISRIFLNLLFFSLGFLLRSSFITLASFEVDHL